ncbi:MAG: hypothetical protein FWB85_04230 [Chitinispirillia bacterium]|nr:hypothetical protein [Chitinispirillia bacterium]MCL2241550.1 hypothetical protein [Chitinispirillia bacterium]
MNRLTLLIIALITSAALAYEPKVPIRNVAVVETQIDEQSGVANEISKAEVRVITDEIRREAVNNLPRARYSVMTSETVQSMGSAVLAECAEENCVIALGSKIGADYIVRGIISKFRDNFTLTVEMYETEYGMLVATASPLRTANLDELLEKSGPACVAMYKKFLEASSPAGAQQTAAPAVQQQQAGTVGEAADYKEQAKRELEMERARLEAADEMRREKRELAKREREQAREKAAEKRLARKYTAGVRQIVGLDWDEGDSFYYGIEPYLRTQRSENKHTYLGLGFTYHKNYNRNDHVDNEYQAAGFMEWHLKDKGRFASLNVYGGPGAVLGYYSYEFYYSTDYGYYDNSRMDVSGFGLDIGGQGGAQLRLGAFVIGVEARALYYMRFWNNGFDGGITIPIGMTLGVAF